MPVVVVAVLNQPLLTTIFQSHLVADRDDGGGVIVVEGSNHDLTSAKSLYFPSSFRS